MFILERNEHNPILSPRAEHIWEAAGAFNWCPVGGPHGRFQKKRFVYRAQSEQRVQDGIRRSVSVIGLAEGRDGIHFDNRSELIKPEFEWEKYGCEDPRVTTIGNVHYIFYTALSKFPFCADGIRVGLAKVDDKMKVLEKHPVTPFNAKAMALFSKKINGKFAALLTVSTDEPPSEICYVEFEKESDIWSEEFWRKFKADIPSHALSIRRSDNEQVELGAPPVLTSEGWLVIYSHIQNYFGGNKTFGVEAVLLDKDDPRKIIAKTKGAIMVPEEYYEQIGHVPNIIFPSGAHIKGKMLEIYYGATDTYSCVARVNLKKFLKALISGEKLFIRNPGNPIISPRKDKNFELMGTFNPAAVDIKGVVNIFYRAASSDNISTFGFATSKNGLSIDERLSEPVYIPRVDLEKRGCEDPRATVIGNNVHIFYTGYDGSVPRVMATSISIENLLKRQWKWSLPKLITLASVNNKDACILPKIINSKYMIIHRLDDMICADFVDSLEWEGEPVRSCIPLLHPRQGMWDAAKIGLACPPVETKDGWLLFYHGVSHTTHYRVGVALLDKKDPTKVISRSVLPIFEPKEEYELKGIVPTVVFPCGVVLRGNTIFLYYGAADTVVGVATGKISEVLETLKN